VSKFNDAELHAIKELDPAGYLRWQVSGLDPDLEWYTWLESQVAPPTGMPMLRGDCVAGLRSRSGTQPPWACLIEAQAQPIPRLAVWLLVYLGLLHEDLRSGPHDRDRFGMLGAVLNLTDTVLATTIDWTPPAPPDGPSVHAGFAVRNVRQESAEQTLAAIASGETALCILVWVPLMEGGDRPEVMERWQELALRQPQKHVRADYCILARTLAELAGREALWTAALKEFDMKDSVLLTQIEDAAIERGMKKGIEKGHKKGLKEGIEKGELIGQIRLLQEILKQSVTPEKDLRKMSKADLKSLLTQLRERGLPNGSTPRAK
jgi:hypothetical protein